MTSAMEHWKALGLPDGLEDTVAQRSIRSAGPSSQPAPSREGDDLEVLEPIGEGGMGVVYRARQHSLDREVALKRLKPNAPPAASQRLCHEAQITGQLEHPNVPPIHALTIADDGRPSLVMKRISGSSYRAVLEDPAHVFWSDHPGDRQRVHVDVLTAVCHALELAHARGFIHRDVKPENIMLGSFGEVFLLDWGLAIPTTTPAPKGVVGTPAYMAPEMLAQKPLSERTDVYLVGATLHHALTGTALHPGQRFVDVVRHIVEAPALTFSSDVPEEVADICRRATHADPDQRYPSVRALREALQSSLIHRASVDLTQSATERCVAATRVKMAESDRRRLLDEARSLVGEALRIWPESQQARRTVDDILRVRTDLEIESKNLAAARAAFGELGAPDPERERQIEQLERTLDAEGARHEALEALASSQDRRAGATARTVALALFGGVIVLFTVVTFALRIDVGYREHLAMQIATSIIGAIILVVLWRRDEHNQHSRQLMIVFSSMVVFGIFFTALGWALQVPIVELLLLEAFSSLPAYIVAGITLDRRTWAALPVAIGGVVFALLVPAHAPLGMPISMLGGVLSAAAAFWWMPVRSVTPN